MVASLVRLSTVALAALLIAGSAMAADGRITGRVTRDNGSPIGGVVVQALGTPRATVTDATGNYVLEVPPGTYTVSFSAGEHTATEPGVVVGDGGTARVDKQVDWRISIAETITVTSASRRAERVVEAPAAVTVIASEDIALIAPSGQAPRAVETAPGVDFTQSGLYDTNFNARGFNSSLNRRILTLIDGRDPAIAFLGAQEWAALSFPLDEMASMELIRGPGSALYGANAFSGVLNMTTKSPRDTPGGRLLLTGGDLDTQRADVRHAGGLGADWYYRVVGGYQQSDDFTRSRIATAEYSILCTQPGQINCLPREARPLALDEVQLGFAGLRFDRHFANTSVLTLESGYATIEGPVFQTGIGRVQVTNVERPWARVNYNLPRWNFGAYYDARRAENQYALASGAPLFEDSHNLHAEAQTNWDFFNRLRVVGGVAWNQQDVDTANKQGIQTLMLEPKSEEQQSVFGQLEFNATPTLKLVGAARWDDSTLHESQFSPKAAVIYSINLQHTVRYGYNEAFQRPNYSELFLAAPAGAPVDLAAIASNIPQVAPLAPILTQLGFAPMPIFARGNSNLLVEKVKSHEVGYAGIYGGRVFLTVDLYQSRLSDFVTDLLPGVNPAFAQYTVPSTLPPQVQGGITLFLQQALRGNYAGLTTVNGRPALVLSYTNAGIVDTRGGEIAVNYYVTNNWVADFNYSRFDFDVKSAPEVGDRLLPNAPSNKFNIGLAWRGQQFDAKVSYRWVDAFDWAAGIFVGHVPQYDVVNLGANYRISDMLAVGVDISNLLNNEHHEAFGGDLLRRRALAFVSVGW